MKEISSDHLKKYIKQQLLPTLAADGFHLYRPKRLIRIRDPFVDIISFQLSQYGSKRFYVHYSIKLLGDPLFDLSGYNLGYRLSNNRENGDETDWVGMDAFQAQQAIDSVVDAYRKTISVWFNEVDSIAGFVFAYFIKNRTASINNLQMAVAFHEAGEQNRASWIVRDIIENGDTENADYLEFCIAYQKSKEAEGIQSLLADDRVLEYMKRKNKTLVVPDNDHKSAESLIGHWKQNNIEKYKFQKYL